MLRAWGKLLLELLAKGAELLPLAADRLLLTRGATTTSRKICNNNTHSEWDGLNNPSPASCVTVIVA